MNGPRPALVKTDLNFHYNLEGLLQKIFIESWLIEEWVGEWVGEPLAVNVYPHQFHTYEQLVAILIGYLDKQQKSYEENVRLRELKERQCELSL